MDDKKRKEATKTDKNDKRLKNLKSTAERTPEEVAIISSKGGKASAKSKRRQASFRESARMLMSMPLKELTEENKDYISQNGIKFPEDGTISDAFVYAVMMNGLLSGDERKLEVIAKMIGDTESHQISKIQAKNDTDRVKIDRERLEAQKQTAQNQNDILAMWTESIIKSGTETEKPAAKPTEEKQTETDDGAIKDTASGTEEPTE